MRSRILLIPVLVISTLMMPQHLQGQRTLADGQMSVRQKVESEVTNLRRNLGRTKEPATRFTLIEKSERQILNLRQKNARQDELDEIYFDKFLAILGFIPRDSDWSGDRCESVKASLVSQFDPHPIDGKLKDPALKMGLLVLQEFCETKPALGKARLIDETLRKP